MRARTIVAILAAAVGLGLLTGWFVLPARSARSSATVPAASPTSLASLVAPTAAASSRGDGSPPPKPATGPVTDRNLLGADAFTAVGFTEHIYVRDRVGDGNYANADCAGEKTLTETLGGPSAHFRGLMTSPDTDRSDPTWTTSIGDQVAREVAAAALSPTLSQNFTERLLLEEVPCQDEPPGHWVYGPTHTLDVAPGVTASWMGTYDGDLNTTGSAPRDKEPCGGLAFLRSGSHYGVLEVDACLDTAAMTRIVRAAVSQL